MATIHVDVVSAEGSTFSGEAKFVALPGESGELGILPHHAPLVSILGFGELRIRKGGAEESFAIVGGFVQVRPDKVVVMELGQKIAEGAPAEIQANPRVIAAYLGEGDDLDQAITTFSARYADQNNLDYEAFVQAVKDGRIDAVQGV